MIDAVLDTTVILHSFRKYKPAITWLNNQKEQHFAVTTITWMEVMEGASSMSNQAQSKATLANFDLIYITIDDQRWAMEQVERFQSSHHLEMNDCLIASVAFRLNMPLYTHNLKDMTPMIGALAIKPYS